MVKIVLIILCVLLLVGMVGLDMFISKDINKRSDNKSETDSDKKNKD